MKKLNILFVCKSLPWESEDRMEKHFWNLSRSLAKIGHYVTVLCGSELEFPENSYIKEDVVITEIPYLSGFYLRSIPFLEEAYFFNQATKKWIDENKEEFDLVKEENNKYAFTSYRNFYQQLNATRQHSFLDNKFYRKIAF